MNRIFTGAPVIKNTGLMLEVTHKRVDSQPVYTSSHYGPTHQVFTPDLIAKFQHKEFTQPSTLVFIIGIFTAVVRQL